MFCPITFFQNKLTLSLANASNEKDSRNRNSNTDTGFTFLGSFGSMITNKIDLLHYHSAQGAEVCIAIIIVTIVAPAMFTVAVASVLSDDPLPK